MLKKSLLARLRRDDRGFSMVVTIGAVALMMVSAAVSVSTLAGDQPVGRKDQDRKVAFAAAEAGLQVYIHKLVIDNVYWTKCQVLADGVNYNWDKPTTGTPTDPRTWMRLTDGSNTDPDGTAPFPYGSAAYTIEMLPANGKPKCDPTGPEASMIDADSAMFRIRVTGQAQDASGKRIGAKRSLIAAFRRASFLDYIYFTDLEVQDPTLYPGLYAQGADTAETSTGRTVEQWGNDVCAKYAYTKTGTKYRTQEVFSGKKKSGTGWTSLTAECVEIQFATNDQVKGPLHTNDAPLICGNPIFGRKLSDRVETSAPSSLTGSGIPADTQLTNGYRTNCSGTLPRVNFFGQAKRSDAWGTWMSKTATVTLPSTNDSLQDEAPPAYTFLGETKLELTAAGIKVISGTSQDGQSAPNRLLPYPPGGVVYVGNSPTIPCTGYETDDPYRTDATGCGIAYVRGDYSSDLTIATADDIILWDDINRQGTALLGLIANNFIRVYHPVSSQSNCALSWGGNNATGTVYNANIDAALLTLRHSFLVDNYGCGGSLGTLSINGAISQKFRGPVGRGSAGYTKNYNYDDRLKVRSPPKFLDPDNAAWYVRNFQEQAPAQ